jgi:hypothetical protein
MAGKCEHCEAVVYHVPIEVELNSEHPIKLIGHQEMVFTFNRTTSTLVLHTEAACIATLRQEVTRLLKEVMTKDSTIRDLRSKLDEAERSKS